MKLVEDVKKCGAEALRGTGCKVRGACPRAALMALCLLWAALGARAARVDTVQVPSPSMGKDVRVIYILPDAALQDGAERCPAIYLLHGYHCSPETWLSIKPDLPDLADRMGVAFVLPDGGVSWYWDSPLQADSRYETFVCAELIAYTDAHYPTAAQRERRAITGFSMGGHGALWCAIRHTDVFGAAGSSSGGVDIRPFPQNWEMARQLGEMAANKATWDAHTVVNQIQSLHNGDLALIIDCGESDFFLEVNKDLHTRLLALGIDHDFITRPGEHQGWYWHNAFDYQFLFFQKYFHRKVKE